MGEGPCMAPCLAHSRVEQKKGAGYAWREGWRPRHRITWAAWATRATVCRLRELPTVLHPDPVQVCIPVACVWWRSESLLLNLGQEPEVAVRAARCVGCTDDKCST